MFGDIRAVSCVWLAHLDQQPQAAKEIPSMKNLGSVCFVLSDFSLEIVSSKTKTTTVFIYCSSNKSAH